MADHSGVRTAVTARASGQDFFIRRPGNPALVALGTGNAVFPGGVTSVSPTGVRSVLVPSRPLWIWPAILVSVAAGLPVAVAWIGGDELRWFGTALVSTVLVGAAVVAYFKASRYRRRRLVLDAPSGCATELDGGRVVLSIPFGLMKSTRVQLYANPRYVDVFDVLITLGFAELWIHQHYSKQAAIELARTVARQVGVDFDPTLERKPPDR